jgi:hypothetical protein
MTKTMCNLSVCNETNLQCPYKGNGDCDSGPICCFPFIPGFHDTEERFRFIDEMDLIECPIVMDMPTGLVQAIEDWIDKNRPEDVFNAVDYLQVPFGH